MKSNLYNAILNKDIQQLRAVLVNIDRDALDEIDPETGRTPLTLALLKSFCEGGLALIEIGATPDCKDASDICNLPYLLAVVNDCIQVVSAILKHSKKPKWPNFALNRVQNPEMLDLLVSYGADVNFVDDDNETPLFTFIQNENCNPLIKRLAEHGADLNHQDGFGVTALMREISEQGPSNLTGYALLLDLGANIIFPSHLSDYYASELIEGMQDIGRNDLSERVKQERLLFCNNYNR